MNKKTKNSNIKYTKSDPKVTIFKDKEVYNGFKKLHKSQGFTQEVK